MSTFFIDYQSFYISCETIVIELCILDTRDVFNPYHYIFSQNIHQEKDTMFDQTSIISDMKPYLINSIFYTNKEKLDTIKKNFPFLRLNYYNTRQQDNNVPKYISCPYGDHGNQCAYKNCLSMCVDYYTSI